MEISEEITEGLRSLNDEDLVSENSFYYLISSICSSLTEDLDEIPPNIENISEEAKKVAFCCFSCLFLEAAKLDITPQDLKTYLQEESLMSDSRSQFVSKAFQKKKDEIKKKLSKTGSLPPKLVDLHYEVEFEIKNNTKGKVNESIFLLDFITRDKIKDDHFKLHCTKSQLQDLLSKFQEASKSLERHSS